MEYEYTYRKLKKRRNKTYLSFISKNITFIDYPAS